jgi:hypothetical protein
MISFSSWILQRESSPHTRARAAAAQGLLPMATVGSIHGRSTASPFEVKKFKKKLNKKKRKKKSKVDETPAKNTAIDSWLKETDKLKDDLARLKDAFQKHKPEKPEKEKPEKEKPEKEKPEEEDIEKTGKPEPDDEKSEKGKKKGSEEEEEVIE